MKIKRLMFAALLAASATGAMAQGNYTINGVAKGCDGKKVFLVLNDKLDSTVVTGGKFAFKGTLTQNFNRGEMALDKIDREHPGNSWAVFVEPKNMTCTVNAAKPSLSKLTGSKTQAEYDAYYDGIREDMEKASKLSDRFYAERSLGHQAVVDSIQKAMAPIGDRINKATETFMANNPDSYLTAEFLSQRLGNMSYDSILTAYNRLTDNVKKSGACAQIVKELDNLSKVRPGKLAPDFTATDINGNQFTLSSLKGKVVILDFWASWCVPCRKSNPHLRALYKKYHDKGLELVYVADDDSNPAAWHKAVEKDSLTGDGFHHVLRGLKWDKETHRPIPGDISDKYAVHFLPTKYLIGRDMKVIFKVADEAALDSKLAELFDK